MVHFIKQFAALDEIIEDNKITNSVYSANKGEVFFKLILFDFKMHEVAEIE